MVRHRPLVWVALVFALGVLTANGMGLDRLQAGWWQLNLLLALVGAALFNWLFARTRWQTLVGTACVLSLIFLLGVTRYTQDRLPIDLYHQKAAYTQSLEGLVHNAPSRGENHTRFLLKPSFDVGLIQVFLMREPGFEPKLQRGDYVVIKNGLEAPRPFLGFDYPGYLAARGIWAVAFVEAHDLEVIQQVGQQQSLLQWGDAARARLFAQLDAALPASAADMLKALMFGARDVLDEQTQEQFRQAGIAHVLAVSGLHLGILLTMLWFLFRMFGVSITLTYSLIAVLVLGYLLVVGFKVSLVRAALLFAFVALGHVFKARGWITSARIDSLQGWAVAALLVLLINPQSVFDVGFQLSFGATAFILLLVPFLPLLYRKWGVPLTKSNRRSFVDNDQLENSDKANVSSNKHGFKASSHTRFRSANFDVTGLRAALARRFLDVVVVSAAAQLGVLPLVAMHFQQLYLGTILANLLILPIVVLVLWWAAVFILFMQTPYDAGWTALGLTTLLQWLTGLAAWLAALPGMSVAVPPPPAWIVVIYYALLSGLILLAQQRWLYASKRSRADAKAAVTS